MRRYIYKRKPRKCPVCKSNSILNIIYGLPSYEMAEDEQAGKIILGGCCQEVNAPIWQCSDCHTSLYKDSGGNNKC